ncbi:MAG: flippase-like domain-containing protein [Bacilli bacterium]|nr:flippase-like domain-containing protein [Bacilli bacterium]
MFLILVIIILLTFNSIYDKKSIDLILKNIKNVKLSYIFLCLTVIFLYFLLQGIYMKTILKSLNKKITLKKGIFYSMIEFYFSGITPSSTGGQPVQLYYMTKDKIPLRKSYITLMLNTIYFKLIMVILGIFVLIFNNSYVFSNKAIYIFFFVLGFITDIIIVIVCSLLIFKQKMIKKILNKIINFASHFNIFRKKLENINVDEILSRYKDELKYINSNKKFVFLNFILTFIQRLLLFSVAYIIYRSLGLNKYTYFDLLLIQVSVQIAIEALPLPGGAGLSEGMLHSIFLLIFTKKLADIGMLLTRTFSFYIPLIICGISVLFYNIYQKIRNT